VWNRGFCGSVSGCLRRDMIQLLSKLEAMMLNYASDYTRAKVANLEGRNYHDGKKKLKW
jgi:hypothetical protein